MDKAAALSRNNPNKRQLKKPLQQLKIYGNSKT